MHINENSSLERENWAVDASPENRPGVPRETEPHPVAGAHWTEPSNQPVMTPVLLRSDLDHPTPVFSSALPPKGATAKMRAMAYRIPDRFVRHWALLLLADRMDALKNLPNWLAKPNGFPAKNGMKKDRTQSAT